MEDQSNFEDAPGVNVSNGSRDSANAPALRSRVGGTGHVTSVVSATARDESHWLNRCGRGNVAMRLHDNRDRVGSASQ